MKIDPEFVKLIAMRLKNGCIEIPAPDGKPVSGPCWIPKHLVLEDQDIDNKYTTLKIKGVSMGSHSAAFIVKYERLPSVGMMALHGCDRKGCCSPEHIHEGNSQQNYEEAVARGLTDPLALEGKAKPWQLGEKNPLAKATDEKMAQAKWLIDNLEAWFTDDIAKHHTPLEAVGIFYELTVPSLKQMKRRENWRGLEPVQPLTMPTSEQIPPDAKPPVPKRGGAIGDENAAEILKNYWQTADKPGFIKDWAKKLKVNVISVQNILRGKTKRKIEPGIQREKDFSIHRHRTLSDRDVQQIRATFAAYPTCRGLHAALARKFNCQNYYVGFIVRRLARLDVPDDPTAIIPMEQLEFKPTAQRGEAHKLCKLSDAAVLEILERHSAGDSPVKLSIENGVSYVLIYNIVRGKTRKKIWERFHRERREREQDGETGGGK